MKCIRKFISLITVITLVFYTSLTVFGQPTTDVDTNSSYEENISFPDGNTYRFVHTTDKYGNRTVTAYSNTGTIDTSTYNVSTGELIVNGKLIPSTTSSLNLNSAYTARSGNWTSGSVDIKNYWMASFTVGAAATAISAFTGGTVAAITGIIAFAAGAAMWLSAVRTTYLNYVSYSPKIGGYYYSEIHNGKDGRGDVLGTVKSNVFVR